MVLIRWFVSAMHWQLLRIIPSSHHRYRGIIAVASRRPDQTSVAASGITPTSLSVITNPVRLLQLHVELRWVEPVVWRRLLAPDTVTLAKLHRILQITLGWNDSHLHEFMVGSQRYGIPDPTWEVIA